MSDLDEGSWSSMPTAALSLLQYVVSVDIYEENPASHIFVVGNISIVFQIIVDLRWHSSKTGQEVVSYQLVAI